MDYEIDFDEFWPPEYVIGGGFKEGESKWRRSAKNIRNTRRSASRESHAQIA
jgi:hypothetical protein